MSENEQAITKLIEQSPHQHIKFAIPDIDGVLRGKMIHKGKFLKGLTQGLGFCDVIFGWDMNDACYNNTTYTGWHSGYPDAFARLDLNTFRTIPWDGHVPFFLGDFSQDANASQLCPRTLLLKTQARCLAMGFSPQFACEYEWFNFKESPQSLADKQYVQLQPLTPGMFGYSLLRLSLHQDYFNAIFKQLEAFGIPLEGLHTETGNGVMEGAILHDTAVNAADKAILFKQSVKEIAYRHQVMASFMAKWNAALPGCGGHIHQSLWDIPQTQNLFYQPEQGGMSDLMKHYLAGQLYCLPHILPMLAPTINSYKRLAGGDWAPATLTWGVENRTTAFRIIHHTPNTTRIEGRTSGADANPYLAVAAYLAAGLYGIEHQLPLISAPVQGNGYTDTNAPKLAQNLLTALQIMEQSEIANTLFGETFVSHFTQTRAWEWRQYERQVSDWELKRYLEII
ncbi:MAG: glutamine synthetase [Saprospiraceae bacterium]|nr:glutamine synthetase [Saprospiraceae bacterium]